MEGASLTPRLHVNSTGTIFLEEARILRSSIDRVRQTAVPASWGVLAVFALACGVTEESRAQSGSTSRVTLNVDDEGSATEESETEVRETEMRPPAPPGANAPAAAPTRGGDVERDRQLRGRWRVTRIGATEVPANARVMIEISEHDEVTGWSGCGAITARARTGPHDFHFIDLTIAEEDCDAASREQRRALLDAMSRTDSRIVGDAGVVFADAMNDLLFVVVAAP